MAKTFKHGTHPPENKITENSPLVEFAVPEKLYISLSQHIGAPAQAIVEVGDSVKAGTLIGKAGGFVSANIFSSVSGKVTNIVTLPTATGGEAKHIEIQNDFRYETVSLPEITVPTKENILERVKEAGIVGMGGATFPTHVKLSPSKPVDTLIINGAECEPYITCDYRLMLEKTDEFIEGVKLLMTALSVEKAYIGIENNKKEAIELLAEKCPPKIEVVELKSKYPQGAEKQLIYSITRRVVPTGGLPMDVGVVVNNVHTAYSVARAIKGEPCYMRAMTVSGDGVEKIGNYFARTGLTYKFIYDECRGNVAEEVTCKVISGGPMMGFAQANLKPATTKGTSSLLFLSEIRISKSDTTACINCGRCGMGCPMNLLPNEIEENTLHRNFEEVIKLNVASCIECGVCTYNCPAKRPLLQAIRLAKRIIKEKGLK
ncbi:MAG: electron transport complex subunit RsxC [Clostridia bacterium]|nr:electron transport complex subunit RsxC [Clostridia bacterium]